jgi:polysaccharide export outer membrane protein
MPKAFRDCLIGLICLVCGGLAWAQGSAGAEYTIGSGDVVRIVVFQNPDLTLESRVPESGAISYPLLGNVQLGGLTIDAAEKKIAKGLRDGGFVPQAQVNISLTQILGNRVSVLGLVGKPGRIPLETANTRVTDILATAGGIAAGGDDIVILIGMRAGKPFRKEIDLPAIYLEGKQEDDIEVAGGDVIYVHRAPMFFIHGEVQRPGTFRVERGMTIQQGLVLAGGLGPRGKESGVRLHRRDNEGLVVESTPKLGDSIKANDVIFVRESLF